MLCAGVTLYNPTFSDFENVKKLLDHFDVVYVYDNSDVSVNTLEQLTPFVRIRIVVNENGNSGLAVAMNRLCRQSLKDGFQFICLLDQDSRISKNFINSMANFFVLHDLNEYAIVVPRVEYAYKNKNKNKNKSIFRISYTEVDWAISSGSFVNLDIFFEVGGFEEKYFIDRIDYDYCYMVKIKGYKIVKVEDAVLYQELGYSCRFIGISFFEHSPLRNYYSFRNRIYFYRYKSREIFFKRYLKILFGSVKQIIKIILFENCKRAKISYLIKAFIDSIYSKYGKYDG